MSRADGAARTVRLVERLVANEAARLVFGEDGDYVLTGPGIGRRMTIPAAAVQGLLSDGLLRPAEPGRLAASSAARSWLARHTDGSQPFLSQHHRLETTGIEDETGRARVLVNREESPIGALSRGASGRKPWLDPDAVSAAERFRRDFERGQLQPRITANWSASVSTGRRDGGGSADLTDAALAARLRFERAVEAIGPEFSGVLTDACCFLKGLEAIESERMWPARSAKLVLRLALSALARHYGLGEVAAGTASPRIRHWGTEDYRPEIG
jgi:hypothetical protein